MMTDFEYTIHGPMWQFECETCHFMGDCWDSEAEALAQMERHNCLGQYRNKFNSDQWAHLVESILTGAEGMAEPHSCDLCGAIYDEAKGDGWCGKCPSCADAYELRDDDE